MGLIKYGPLAQEVSGTVGGVTFARVRQAKAVRGWRAPTNKRRAAQLSQRSNLSRLSAAWRLSIPPEVRAEWDAYAPSCTFTNPLGELYTITGFQFYLRNTLIQMPRIVEWNPNPPTLPSFPEIPTVQIVLSIATRYLRITYLDPIPPEDTIMWYTVHTLRPITRAFPFPRALKLDYIQISEPAPIDLYYWPTPVPGLAGDNAVLVTYYISDPHRRFSTMIYHLAPTVD